MWNCIYRFRLCCAIGWVVVLGLFAAAAPVRVVTFNIETNRDADGYVTEALNDPGTADFNAVRDVLARIDADVVCLQELANPDVAGGTGGESNSDVHALAAELGLGHVFIPTNSGVFDFTLRNAVLSRFPFLGTEAVGSAAYMEEIGMLGTNGGRPKDVTRVFPVVEVQVPGAADPLTLVTLHTKSGTGSDDRFRRAVELDRLGDYLSRSGFRASDNLLLLGDFNLSGLDKGFEAEPSGLPTTWNRGVDIPLPIAYSTDPDFYFATPYGLTAVDARAVNGDDDTTWAGSVIDFVLTTPGLEVTGSEVYRSLLDLSNEIGLVKPGDPPDAEASALASDHYAVFVDLDLSEESAPTSYVLDDEVRQVSECFDGFGGWSEPARWVSQNVDWSGVFDGQGMPGAYAFGGEADRSLGMVPSASPASFTAAFENRGSSAISSLEISYLARQVVASDPGTTDTLRVGLRIDGGAPADLPELAFTAVPDAAVPDSRNLSASLSGLAIPAGASFSLEFTGTRGPVVWRPLPDGVFINEIHYDNAGGDSGEFVEVVVAPGFAGDVAGVSVVLYNGLASARKPYGDGFPLVDAVNFANPTVINGYRIYELPVPGIQNGGPDGIALMLDGAVVEFLSYEGSFEAAEGPASGTSTDIGVDQDPEPPAGFGSLGLSGIGGGAGDFAWVRFANDVAHTPGQPNPNQTFSGSLAAPSQAFSFDDVTVSIPPAEPDNDGDGDPDVTDPDDDNDSLVDEIEAVLGTNPYERDSDGDGTPDGDEDADGDGQGNAAEVLVTLTDPLDRNSRFVAVIEADSSGGPGFELVFPSLEGRRYRVFESDSLSGFELHSSHSGTGVDLRIAVPSVFGSRFFVVHADMEP